MGVYPPNDEWCESLACYDGYWYFDAGGASGCSLSLDDQDKIIGDYSIRFDHWTYDFEGVDIYFKFLPLEKGFDFSKVYQMELALKLNTIGDNWEWQENIGLYIAKDNGNYAKRIITVSKELEDVWVPIVFDAGPDSADWEIVGDFDWSKVAYMKLHLGVIIPAGYWPPPPFNWHNRVSIDGLLLYIKEEYSEITVRSEPISNVEVRLDGESPILIGCTPVTRWVTPSVRTLIVPEQTGGYEFKSWEDGTTTPERQVDLTVPGKYEFTAYYEHKPAPPPPPVTPPAYGVPVWKPSYLIQYLLQYYSNLILQRIRRRL